MARDLTEKTQMDGRDCQLLVVLDDPSERAKATSLMRKAGIMALESQGGRQALTIFEEKRPDIVILGTRMPDLDSSEVCFCLRGMHGGKHASIFILTDIEDTQTINRAFDAGATDLIARPIDWAKLAQRMQSQLLDASSRELLQDNAEKQRLLIRSMPDLLIQLDSTGRPWR